MIDLRSDTVTQPTPAMRRAMYEAEVGDDVYGEDPTVNRLEALAAAMLGKEAALLVTSGTQGNLAAVLTHCGRGDEVIVGHLAHMYLYEQGGMAALAGVQPRVVPNQANGTLALDEVEAAIRPENIHFPRTRLIAIENTHNRRYGAPLSLDYLRGLRALADRHGLPIHMDGARLFNAAVALGVPARDLAAQADTVMVCLSKGLSAPIGSLLLGPADFIAEARRARKVLGGGMRQAGVIAAAGIVALTQMVDRLADDHARARRLAEALAALPGLRVDLARVHTNMVYVDLEPPRGAEQVAAALAQRGVRVHAVGPQSLRLVTHYGIEDEDIAAAIDAFAAVLRAG
ncbi:MAG: low-specificity L-threonine aldolase [Chloroflexi bacterium]|nr:low-specificity L-threonine aldolase [Chloroflexota bacterium]